MHKIDCPNWKDCGVPICPKDSQSAEKSVWFPGEAVCPLRRNIPTWVRLQRRLAKALKLPVTDNENVRHEYGYFSAKMLQCIHKVSDATRGANPDAEGSESRFLAARATTEEGANTSVTPKRKPLSPMAKQQFRDRMVKGAARRKSTTVALAIKSKKES
jgi:hypothetical protein